MGLVVVGLLYAAVCSVWATETSNVQVVDPEGHVLCTQNMCAEHNFVLMTRSNSETRRDAPRPADCDH